MNRFEAQNSPHTRFCAHDFSKRNFSYMQNIFYYLQTPFCILYQVLIKTILKTIKIFKTFFQNSCFWPSAVNRAVDRLCFRSERSTDWSTGLLTIWVRACVHVSRSTGRSTGPHFGRPTFGRLKVINSLFVSIDRAVNRGPQRLYFFKTQSTGRSTEA